MDSGFKKEKEYIFRTSGGELDGFLTLAGTDYVAIEHLKKKNISKAAAWQRTGRAGREVSFSRRTPWQENQHSMCSVQGIVSDYSLKKRSKRYLSTMLQRSKDVISLRRYCNW